MSARTVAVVGIVAALAGCGGGAYQDLDYSPAAVVDAAGEAAKTGSAARVQPPAEDKTPAKPAVMPKDAAEFVKALPANPRKMSDGLARNRGWNALNWANPADVSAWRKQKSADDVVLVVLLKGGDKDKAAVSRPVDIAADADGELRMDVYSAASQEVPIAFAAFASVDRVYSESAPQSLKPGWNRVVFDLSAPTFKTAASEWKNDTKLWGADDVREIAILFYLDKPAAFAIDGIEVDGKVTEPE